MEQIHGTLGQNFGWAWRRTSWWRPWRRPWRLRLWRVRQRYASRRGSAPSCACSRAQRGVSGVQSCQRARCALLPAVRWIPCCGRLHSMRHGCAGRRQVLRTVRQGNRLILASRLNRVQGTLRHLPRIVATASSSSLSGAAACPRVPAGERAGHMQALSRCFVWQRFFGVEVRRRAVQDKS